MGLLLSTHDTGYEGPDEATIAKVLASLDGGRNVVATLSVSDSSYLQVTGSVQTGFALELQEGSLERRHRSKDHTLSLDRVTEAFQRYARSDMSWRERLQWEREEYRPPAVGWLDSWLAYILLMVAVGALVWWWQSR